MDLDQPGKISYLEHIKLGIGVQVYSKGMHSLRIQAQTEPRSAYRDSPLRHGLAIVCQLSGRTWRCAALLYGSGTQCKYLRDALSCAVPFPPQRAGGNAP